MTNEELKEVEAQLEEAKEAVRVGEAFKRLLANDDYKLVIEKGYLTDYPKEIGENIAKNTGAYDEDKLITDLKSTNSFVGYGFRVAQAHMQAEETIAGLDELLANQGEE